MSIQELWAILRKQRSAAQNNRGCQPPEKQWTELHAYKIAIANLHLLQANESTNNSHKVFVEDAFHKIQSTCCSTSSDKKKLY